MVKFRQSTEASSNPELSSEFTVGMDSLLEKITCSICNLPFSDLPKVLPGCLHVFCLACLNKLPIDFALKDPPPVLQQEENSSFSDSESFSKDSSRGLKSLLNEGATKPPRPSRSLSVPSEKDAMQKRTRSASSEMILSTSCPKCNRLSRLPSTGFSGLRTSYIASHLAATYQAVKKFQSKLSVLECDQCVEKSPAVSYCSTCQSLLCEDHLKCHQKWKEFSRHNFFSLDLLSSDSKDSSMIKAVTPPLHMGGIRCQKHSKHENNQFKFFCSICGDLACTNCTVTDHRDEAKHSCVSITQDFVSDKRAMVLKSLEELDNLVQDLDIFAGKIQTKSEDVSKKASILKDRIDATFTEIADTLDSRKLSIFDKVDTIISNPLKKLKEITKKLEILKNHVLQSRSFIQGNLECEGDLGLLSLADVICSHTKVVMTEYKQILPEIKVKVEEVKFTDDTDQLYDAISEFGSVSTSDSRFSSTPISSPERQYPQFLSCSIDSTGSVFNANLQDSLTGTYVYSLPTFPRPFDLSPVVIDVPKVAGIHVRTIKGVSKPCGIRIEKNMNLVVCEFGSHQVVTMDQSGSVINRLGTKGDKNGQFLYPQKTVHSPDDKIMVVDSMYRVQIFNKNRRLLKSVGTKGKGRLQFNDPVAIAIAPDKRIFILERTNQRIQILSSNFSFLGFIGKAGRNKCEFYLPNDIAIDENGHLYVADTGNHRIQVLTLDGSFVLSFGTKGSNLGELCQPSHLCVDSDGIFVAEEGNHRISIFTLNGEFIKSIGRKGTGPGEFSRPLGLAIDRNKTLYVSDCNNNRIQVIK